MELLIDTDPGVDDAIALLMALRRPGVRVAAVTVVAGNVGLDNTVRNARYLLELCGVDAPLYAGADRALLREPRRAPEIHGNDGLGNLGLRPRAPAPPSPLHAADAIIETVRANPGAITLVTLGPLTNVALALLKAPAIAGMVKEAVVMGGAANVVGNATPAAEFNIWADPEAARIVFRAGLPLTMVGIEVSRGAARWTAPEIKDLADIGTERARVAAAMLDQLLAISHARATPGDTPGAGVPDGVAMAAALDPSVITESGRYFVDVETHGELTTGETVVDRRGVLGRPANATVVHAVDPHGWRQMVRDACR